jgi:hypothetical protein
MASRAKKLRMNHPADRQNPLLFERPEPVADPDAIRKAHCVLVRERYRDIRDLRRKETAAEAVAGLDLDGREIFGLTKGQFSLIDMIEAVLERTGPARLSISTWTAAGTDVSTALDLIASGRVTAARWLTDTTFTRRCPQLAARIREAFGPDAIRVSRNHAKFTLVENETWRVVIRTSMNLNHNPRLEDFTVAHDPELADFLGHALDDLWRTQRRSLADGDHNDLTRWWHEHG